MLALPTAMMVAAYQSVHRAEGERSITPFEVVGLPPPAIRNIDEGVAHAKKIEADRIDREIAVLSDGMTFDVGDDWLGEGVTDDK